MVPSMIFSIAADVQLAVLCGVWSGARFHEGGYRISPGVLELYFLALCYLAV